MWIVFHNQFALVLEVSETGDQGKFSDSLNTL